MAGKSFISFPMIIACIVGYNLFFGDDDEEKKKVDPPKDKTVINIEVSDDLKETGKELLKVAKKAVAKAKEEFIDKKKEIEEKLEDKEKEKEPDPPVVEKEKEPEVVVTKDTSKEDDALEPLDDTKEDEETFKAL